MPSIPKPFPCLSDVQPKQKLRVSKGDSKCHRGDGGLLPAPCRLYPSLKPGAPSALPSRHQPGTQEHFSPPKQPGRSSWAVSGRSKGSVSLSYWQRSLCFFQLPSRPIPGCLRGTRPRASTSASYSQITQPALEFLNSFMCLGGFLSCP